MHTQTIVARTFGYLFILIGILGFFDNALVSRDGIFGVNGLHNVVHLASGAIALLAGYMGTGARQDMNSRRYNMTFGWIYAAVMLLGFLGLLDFLNVNMADNFLHLAFTVVLLGTAYGATSPSRHAART